ncbi:MULTISPECIES: hypothetical protein [Halolamina]|uniref:DUF8156 domain-containing protein n=1 Tax=Halolamina pelagica TaxID=699431 RepID=A0A1I5MTG8_9EURY|nr:MULTISPECIES: hypothetical protein [Halolamina]NHX36151.1 hypothetical protein [Halolamina sp. R1-12]SFP12815.1 hypothetical protein SAMN05216277_101397 [Halolamina pelagica]
MGRSNPTHRDSLRRLEERWGDYRRALRRRDQAHFDRLWEHAAAYADAAGYQNAERPLDLALVSIVLAQERRIAALEAELEARP